jgi:aminopeptidase N
MLRSQLGEELYRRCIKTYLERHQFQNVVTDDLRAVIEELSGRSYDQFFDQWVYHAHHPELEIAYSFDTKSKLAKLSVKQTQRLSDDVLLFHFPLSVRFKGSFGTVDHEIVVKEKEEDFYFALDVAPTIVRADPNYTLLAKVTFNLPNTMLYAQLTDKDDAVGRLLAIQQLSSRKDKESVAKLKERLNNDPFYGARLEASRTLRSIHTDEALESLLASTQQSDARIRRQVVDDIGSFYRDAAYGAARKTLDAEKNPDILGEAIQAIGGYGKAETRDVILKFLNSESYRNTLAVAALRAVRLQDDPAYVTPLIDTLFKRQSAFTSGGFGIGLETLGYIARNQENRDAPREFLMIQVTHPKRSVRSAAIRALETLGDPKALAVLQTFAGASKETPERAAAERAVATLRGGRKPVDDFKNLRNEVLDLQKQNRELRKELDDLKKKMEPAGSQPAESTSRKKPSPSRK